MTRVGLKPFSVLKEPEKDLLSPQHAIANTFYKIKMSRAVLQERWAEL